MGFSARRRYVNKQYDNKLLRDLHKSFDKKVGRDISQLIIGFINIEVNQKCRICDDKIGKEYCNCLRRDCNNKICDDCYKITSRFNGGRPYCDRHFIHWKYKKNINKHFKRQLIKKMKNKIKKYDINRIHYIYKNKYNQRIINKSYRYNKYKQYFKFPKRTHIRCNHYMEVIYDTLHVIFVDNIHDSFYY